MTSEVAHAGLDWGSFKTSLAVWGAEGTRMIAGASSELHVPSAVAFRPRRGGDIDATFPVSPDWPTPPEALVFDGLKRHLARCGTVGVQTYVATPVMQYWRAAAPAASGVSVAVPFEYSSDVRTALLQAAQRAGFPESAVVLDVVAAALAYLPRWQRDEEAWQALGSGRDVWIVDAGLFDISLTVVRVERSGAQLTFSVRAADRLAHLGGRYESAAEGEAVDAAVIAAVRRLSQAASAQNTRIARGSAPGAGWIVPCGGAPSRDAAVRALARAMSPGAIVWNDLDPREVHARGAAIHAACRAGALPHAIATLKRPLIGVLVEGSDMEFAPMTSVTDEPPCDFEGAFELSSGSGHPFELSVAAAPAGGARSMALVTWVLDPQTTGGEAPRVVLVRGRLESWDGGTVELVDIEDGRVVRQSEFRVA